MLFHNQSMQNRTNISVLHRSNISQIQTNTPYNIKDTQVDILFKGLQRKISQKQYSKIKNSYKVSKKDAVKTCINNDNNSIIGKTGKLRLSINSNQIMNQNQVYEQVLKMKERNHFYQEQNTELLRKIRKQQKIEEIYRKKMQGKDLSELTYQKALQIKLLLQLEDLQSQFQQKQRSFTLLQKEIRSKKNESTADTLLFQKKVQLYGMMINNQEQFELILTQKQNTFAELQKKLQKLKQNSLKQKQLKNEKKQQLTLLKKTIKERKEKLNILQDEMKKKQQNSSIIKSGGAASSITVKNRNNIQQIQNEIQKIKEEYQMLSEMIQTQMDQKIKQKILLHKEISQYEDSQKIKMNWQKIKPSPLTMNLKV